jgi:hypothetical protein
MYQALRAACAIICLIIAGCSGDSAAFDVDCRRVVNSDGHGVQCGDVIIEGEKASDRQGGADSCEPYVPLAGVWVQDDSGASSLGAFVLPPTGTKWRFLFIAPDARGIAAVNVPIRPKVVPPAQPINPAVVTLFRNYPVPVPTWTSLDETKDVTAAPSYELERAIVVGAGIDGWAEAGGLYEISVQAPLSDNEHASIVITGAPYLSAHCPE